MTVAIALTAASMIGDASPLYRTHAQNGDPHLTYYDPSSTLSFVWTGHTILPVEVEMGGYGEPVVARFTVEPPAVTCVADLMTWFAEVCQTWADQWDGEAA